MKNTKQLNDKKGIKFSKYLILVFLGCCNSAFASDPCDFSQADAFLPSQVMSCYSQVPYSQSVANAVSNAYELPNQVSDLAPYYANSGPPLFINAPLIDIKNKIANSNASNDFAFHESVKKQLKRFKSPHWDYRTTLCYQNLYPFIPLEIGVRLGAGNKQELYVKDNPFEPTLYKQVTGIDTENLVGKTIVSIDNKPALDALVDFSDASIAYSSFSSNNFAAALQRGLYSIISASRDVIPDNLSPTYVFSDEHGNPTELQLPWIFVKRARIFGPDISYPPHSQNTAQFQATCQAPWTALQYYLNIGFINANSDSGETPQLNRAEISSPQSIEKEDKQRKKAISKFKNLSKHFAENKERLKKTHKPLPFEVISDEISNDNSVLYGQLGNDTTVIKVINFAPNDETVFINTLNAAVAYACVNSDKVILDLATNSGGSVHLTAYLVGLFNPALSDGTMYKSYHPFANPQTRPLLAIYNNGTDFLSSLTGGGCNFGGESSCWLRDDGTPLPLWSQALSTQGIRGQQPIELTERLTSLPPSQIQQVCPYKFKDNNLIVLTDGTAASGGVIAAASLRKIGVVIGYHGLKDKTTWIGFAQGGIVRPYHAYYSKLVLDLLPLLVPELPPIVLQILNPSFRPPLPVQADFRFETPGSILDPAEENTQEILNSVVLTPNARIDIWDDDEPAVVYTEALKEAKKGYNKVPKKF